MFLKMLNWIRPKKKQISKPLIRHSASGRAL